MSTWRIFAACLCFAECIFLLCRVVFFQHSAKSLVCRVPLFCRVWFLQHSTNNFFAECPMECTRQIFWRSANHLFSVVLIPNTTIYSQQQIVVNFSNKLQSYQLHPMLCSVAMTHQKWSLHTIRNKISKITTELLNNWCVCVCKLCLVPTIKGILEDSQQASNHPSMYCVIQQQKRSFKVDFDFKFTSQCCLLLQKLLHLKITLNRSI